MPRMYVDVVAGRIIMKDVNKFSDKLAFVINTVNSNGNMDIMHK